MNLVCFTLVIVVWIYIGYLTITICKKSCADDDDYEAIDEESLTLDPNS